MDRIVILGLGNMLYGDEALGVHAAQRLWQEWDFPEHVEVVDGGTQGHGLLTCVESAHSLLILDAVDMGLAPGQVVVREGKEIPMYLTSQKISPHQNSFSEVLALAELRGRLPHRLALAGMQPHSLHMGEALSDTVNNHMELLIKTACCVLRRWGVDMRPAAQSRHLFHPALLEMRTEAEHANTRAHFINRPLDDL